MGRAWGWMPGRELLSEALAESSKSTIIIDDENDLL